MRNTPTRSQAAFLEPTYRRFHNYFCLALLLIGTAVFAAQEAFANTPTIRLFPTTVVEDLRQTGNVARDMQTRRQEVIVRHDQQQELYTESKCDGAENDSG